MKMLSILKIFSVVIIIYILTLQLSAVGQQLAGQKALEFPSKYYMPASDVEYKYRKQDSVITGMPWKVCSDKDDNFTYYYPEPSRKMKRLNFLEALYVLEEKGKYLHVIKDPNIYSTVFSENAEDYGWINMTDLLLWQNCLSDPETKNYLKGIVKNQEINLSDVPESRTRANYSLVYIYKQSNEFALVGYDNYFDETLENYESNFGWIALDKITAWNNKFAFKVNTNESALIERKTKEVTVNVFIDEKSAIDYQKCNDVISNNIIWDNDPFDTSGFNKNIYFPVLQVFDSVSQITFFGDLSLHSGTISGYITTSSSCLDNPLFSKLLLMNKFELVEVIKKIQTLENNKYNSRAVFIENLKILVAKYTELPHTDPNFLELSFPDVFEELFYISNYTRFNNYSLKDLQNESMVAETEFKDFLIWLKNVNIVLREILNENKTVETFHTLNQQYYWIPAELIP